MNNFANIDISAKSLYDVSLGTQRKGLMEKNETKNSHATIPLRFKGVKQAKYSTVLYIVKIVFGWDLQYCGCMYKKGLSLSILP
jgi:hypothetical protein